MTERKSTTTDNPWASGTKEWQTYENQRTLRQNTTTRRKAVRSLIAMAKIEQIKLCPLALGELDHISIWGGDTISAWVRDEEGYWKAANETA